jgi:hypothetical protein
VWLLGVTVTVSLLHSLFEFLAFKNGILAASEAAHACADPCVCTDISFWNKKSDGSGISVRTIATNVFFQLVILLYLLDEDGTSWVIIVGQGIGLAIEAWKITKAARIRVQRVDHRAGSHGDPHAILSILGWRLTVKSRHQYSEMESKTREYDEVQCRKGQACSVRQLTALMHRRPTAISPTSHIRCWSAMQATRCCTARTRAGTRG